MIHIFKATTDEYDLMQTIDVHSTSIIDISMILTTFSVKNKNKMTHYEKQLRLYSISSDKTLNCHRFSTQEQRWVLA
jgi:hypothetical protein